MNGARMTVFGRLGLFVGLSLLGCNLLVVTPPDDSGNTNTNDNAVDDANDNTVDNTNDNIDDTTNFAVFDDPDSDFSTTDVRDVDDEVIRFDTVTQAIVYVADGTSYQHGSWSVDGVFLGRGAFFQVRFGSVGGDPRAYFTETATAAICDFLIQNGEFFIFLTNTPVPQN